MANKVKKCATNRFWLKFGFLTVITLGIYAIVFYVRWGKDLNRIKEKAGIEGKPLMNAFGAMILGIVTIGIVPLTWIIKMVLRTYHAAKVLGTEKKGSTALVLIFCSLLSWTIVCPIIGFHKLCKTMNNLGKWYNQQLETPAIEEQPEPAVLPEPVEEIKVEEPAVDETPVVAPTPVEEPKVEEPAPAKKPAPKAKKPAGTKPAPAAKPETKKVEKTTKTTKEKTKKEEKPAPAEKPEKTGGVGANGAKIYHISKRKDDGKWQVKFANGSKAIKLFDTQAEAIEFAKTLAKNQEGSIRIHSVKGKIRK